MSMLPYFAYDPFQTRTRTIRYSPQGDQDTWSAYDQVEEYLGLSDALQQNDPWRYENWSNPNNMEVERDGDGYRVHMKTGDKEGTWYNLSPNGEGGFISSEAAKGKWDTNENLFDDKMALAMMAAVGAIGAGAAGAFGGLGSPGAAAPTATGATGTGTTAAGVAGPGAGQSLFGIGGSWAPAPAMSTAGGIGGLGSFSPAAAMSTGIGSLTPEVAASLGLTDFLPGAAKAASSLSFPDLLKNPDLLKLAGTVTGSLIGGANNKQDGGTQSQSLSLAPFSPVNVKFGQRAYEPNKFNQQALGGLLSRAYGINPDETRERMGGGGLLNYMYRG